MTDAEIRDAAVAELKKTTVGYKNKHWTTPPAGSQWEKGLGLLAQIGQAPPPPPPPSNAYFVADYANGLIQAPWTSVFSYTGTGSHSIVNQGPISQSPEGRVKVVPNLYGSGNCLRCEIRDSDPGWPVITNVQKSEVRSKTNETFNGPQTMGVELWVRMQIAFTSEFVLSSDFTDIADLHPGSSTGWPTIGLVSYPGNYIQVQLDGGDGSKLERPNLLPLDAAHRNRWVDVVLGAKLHDTSGWFEAWVDGVNVIPRKNRPTIWPGDLGCYWKQGLYKRKSSSFPGGKSVIHFGATKISKTRPF